MVGLFPFLLVAVFSADLAIMARCLLIGIFLLLTTPISTHAIGWAAYTLGKPMETPGAVDEFG